MASSSPLDAQPWAKNALIAGAILGAAAGAYNLMMVAAELYLQPFWAFWLVMGLEALALVVLLCRMVSGRRFWSNLGAGLLIFAAAAPLVALSTWIGWTVVAPDYADVFAAFARSRMEAAGRSAEQIDSTMQTIATAYQPAKQTYYALVGTLLTGPVYTLPVALLRWLASRWRRTT